MPEHRNVEMGFGRAICSPRAFIDKNAQIYPLTTSSAPTHGFMQTNSLSIEVGTKSISLIITPANQDTLPACALILGHGASGDTTTGNLPAIAEHLSRAGITVVRYTCNGQLPTRVKVLQVYCKHGGLRLAHASSLLLESATC